jgi:7-cyano-7-deazaguanine synthase
VRIVSLTSGGLDSSLMMYLIRDEGHEQIPVFVNYGQINLAKEIEACRKVTRKLKLGAPTVIDISNWGKSIGSGLTSRKLRVFEDAFLPGRNLMLLLVGASLAYRKNAAAISIGLLSDQTTIFPDQTKEFCEAAEALIGKSMDARLKILCPLKALTKAEVVAAAKHAQITGTYSCHSGTKQPCGRCVACREYAGMEA